MTRMEGNSADLAPAAAAKEMVSPSTCQLCADANFTTSAGESNMRSSWAEASDNSLYATAEHSAMDSRTVSTTEVMKKVKHGAGMAVLAASTWLKAPTMRNCSSRTGKATASILRSASDSSSN